MTSLKAGLKIWSVNDNYSETVRRVIEKDLCSYVEIYYVPGSFDKFKRWWRGIRAPVLVHGPTTQHGLNPAVSMGGEMFREVFRFADWVGSEKIIFHPGMGGSVKNTVGFFKPIDTSRVIMENMPFLSLDYRNCQGASPEELNEIVERLNTDFCLDVGHAIKYSCSVEKDYLDVIKEFNKIAPVMYHFSDGFSDNEMDEHLNLGKGNFSFSDICSLINGEQPITLETAKKSDDFFEDYYKDFDYLSEIWRKTYD